MINSFMQSFLMRCKLKYDLAFIQWRNQNGQSNLEELEKLFTSNNSRLQETVKKRLSVHKKEKKGDKDANIHAEEDTLSNNVPVKLDKDPTQKIRVN